jgi:hypothetical protein
MRYSIASNNSMQWTALRAAAKAECQEQPLEATRKTTE